MDGDVLESNITILTEIDNDPYPFENFAPTLSQCFVIVTVGYLLSKFDVLSKSDVSGVNGLAAYFAMPGIICASLAVAEFDDFRWELLIGVFLGKLLTFIAVACPVLFLTGGNAGEAGALAIFCVQSNDLPVGNPLMSSLYKEHRPGMMKYLFFIPAMTVIFFVPMGTIMINIHRKMKIKDKSSSDAKSDGFFWKHFRWRDVLDQVRGLVKHPVILSTALGLILNFSFDGKAPIVLLHPIRVAAATIPGIALSLLGFSFVGRERFLICSSVVPAMGLVFLKMVLTPVLLHTILKLLTEDSPSSNLLSDFALLYGIISPATGILQFGKEFRKPVAVMSAALIVTSLSCFPVSYIVARFTIAPVHKMSDFGPQLKNVLFWTACGSVFSSVAVWFAMVVKKRWSQFPWCYVTFFAFIQCLMPCGILFWCLTGNEMWTTYCKMFLYYCGEIAGYFWTAVLAFLLLFEEKHAKSARRTFSFMSFAVFSISALISVVMCLLIPHNRASAVFVIGRARSNFQYLQLITASVILFISLSIVLVCLSRHYFKRRKRINFLDGGHDNPIFYTQEQDVDLSVGFKKNPYDILKRIPKFGKCGEADFFYQDVVNKSGASPESQLYSSKEWKNRLVDLMTIQGLVMSVRLIANLYKIVRSRASEIMIPMEFLQSVLFVGQGMILFLIFGIDIRTVTISIRKWWRKNWLEKGKIPSNFSSVPNEEAAQFCKNFYDFYFDQSFADIAKERRWKDAVYKDCFWGHQLVDWMISEGLCVDASEAEGLGRVLQSGGVIEDVAGKRTFCDAPRLYCFVKPKTTDSSHEEEKSADELII